tara:strand:- start:1546 stop:2148 length:603 start_codon:yes stop_codon:yes gene_type:complete
MKNRIYIYSNEKLKNFLTKFLPKYEIFFINIDSLQYNLAGSQANIIIINNKKDADLINFKKLNDNFLIIFNLKHKDLKFNNKVKLLKSPLSVEKIKNAIENFIHNLQIQFYDICIHNEKLTNLKNKNFCYLTKVEVEILYYLIRERQATKNFIKENILNIKSNIETNSLESHLTRIRKKFFKIKTVVKIQTKNDKLLITP